MCRRPFWSFGQSWFWFGTIGSLPLSLPLCITPFILEWERTESCVRSRTHHCTLQSRHGECVKNEKAKIDWFHMYWMWSKRYSWCMYMCLYIVEFNVIDSNFTESIVSKEEGRAVDQSHSKVTSTNGWRIGRAFNRILNKSPVFAHPIVLLLLLLQQVKCWIASESVRRRLLSMLILLFVCVYLCASFIWSNSNSIPVKYTLKWIFILISVVALFFIIIESFQSILFIESLSFKVNKWERDARTRTHTFVRSFGRVFCSSENPFIPINFNWSR